jgi:hypothetical protein
MVAMHLLVPFAAPLSDAGRAALSTLQLPRLQALLARLGEPRRDDGDEWSLSPPHERALAREAGVPGVADGLVPLAALEARRAGLASPGSPEGWAWLWPAHWRLGTEQVSLHDPAALRLDEAQSRALLHRSSSARASSCTTACRMPGWPGTTRCPTCPPPRWTASSAATWTAGSAPTRGAGCCAGCRTRSRCCCTTTR